jgi:hypothetical protein
MAGFAKLYSSLTESSLWCERDDVRILFVTMLALADKNGCVKGSRGGLMRAANIAYNPDQPDPFDVLMAPDNDSSDLARNPERQGRRIEEIPGGFRLINFCYYRNLRSPEKRRAQLREAQAKFRAKKKGNQDVIKGNQASSSVIKGNQASSTVSHGKPDVINSNQDVIKGKQLSLVNSNQGVINSNQDVIKSNQDVIKSKPKQRAEAEAESTHKNSNTQGSSTRTSELEYGADANKSNQHQHQKLNGLADSEWLARLAKDKTYAGIAVHREFGKMANWCKVHRKLPTRLRFVNWLNRIEVMDSGIQAEEENEDRGPEGWETVAHELYPDMHFPASFWEIQSPEVIERIKEKLS